MERKRASSQRGSTVVEARSEASKKPLKLVLSAARPSKRRKTSALLEECAQVRRPLSAPEGPGHVGPPQRGPASMSLVHSLRGSIYVHVGCLSRSPTS